MSHLQGGLMHTNTDVRIQHVKLQQIRHYGKLGQQDLLQTYMIHTIIYSIAIFFIYTFNLNMADDANGLEQLLGQLFPIILITNTASLRLKVKFNYFFQFFLMLFAVYFGVGLLMDTRQLMLEGQMMSVHAVTFLYAGVYPFYSIVTLMRSEFISRTL